MRLGRGGGLGGQVPILYGGTILRGAIHLGGSSGFSKAKVPFLTHLQQLKGYLVVTDLVKNQSMGVVEGVLHTCFGFMNKPPNDHLLFQKVPILEMSKSCQIFLTPQILEF